LERGSLLAFLSPSGGRGMQEMGPKSSDGEKKERGERRPLEVLLFSLPFQKKPSQCLPKKTLLRFYAYLISLYYYIYIYISLFNSDI